MAFDAVSLDTLSRQSKISALDVVRLRDALTHDGPVTFGEALALAAIEGSRLDKHHGWKDLYIDAMVAHAVSDTAPEGYVDSAKAERLLALAAPSGRVVSHATFEMLCAVAAKARWVPERLTCAILDEILCAVACGDGALREGTETTAGVVTELDAERVRRTLYAASKAPLYGITRREAQAVLAIDRAAGEHDPAWSDLCACVLIDAALTASQLVGPPRPDTLAPSRGSQGAALSGAGYRAMSGEEQAILDLERQRVAIITGDTPEAFDAAALADALAGHPATPAWLALQSALRELSPMLHPRLQVRRAASSVRAA